MSREERATDDASVADAAASASARPASQQQASVSAHAGGQQQAADGETVPPAGGQGDFQVLADGLLASLAEGLAPEDAALALAVLVNRAGTRLHNLARGEAGARKAQPEWPAWAQLQNATRTMLLQASTCRDLAARLAGRRQ